MTPCETRLYMCWLNSSPEEVRVWVQEHKPKTSEVAAQLADNYLQARQIDPVVSEGRKSVTPNPIVCGEVQKMRSQGAEL